AFQSENVRSEGIVLSIEKRSSKIKLIKNFGVLLIQFIEVLIRRPEIRIQKSPGISISREEELYSIQSRGQAESFFKI
ncbi:MAG: hypothetical protein ACK5V3_15320, partial [Bdellovibrionales bacterium]